MCIFHFLFYIFLCSFGRSKPWTWCHYLHQVKNATKKQTKKEQIHFSLKFLGNSRDIKDMFTLKTKLQKLIRNHFLYWLSNFTTSVIGHHLGTWAFWTEWNTFIVNYTFRSLWFSLFCQLSNYYFRFSCSWGSSVNSTFKIYTYFHVCESVCSKTTFTKAIPKIVRGVAFG